MNFLNTPYFYYKQLHVTLTTHIWALKLKTNKYQLFTFNRQYYTKVGWYDNSYTLTQLTTQYYWYVQGNQMKSFQLSSVIQTGKGISFDNGWFNPKILQTVKITNTNTSTADVLKEFYQQQLADIIQMLTQVKATLYGLLVFTTHQTNSQQTQFYITQDFHYITYYTAG